MRQILQSLTSKEIKASTLMRITILKLMLLKSFIELLNVKLLSLLPIAVTNQLTEAKSIYVGKWWANYSDSSIRHIIIFIGSYSVNAL